MGRMGERLFGGRGKGVSGRLNKRGVASFTADDNHRGEGAGFSDELSRVDVGLCLAEKGFFFFGLGWGQQRTQTRRQFPVRPVRKTGGGDVRVEQGEEGRPIRGNQPRPILC